MRARSARGWLIAAFVACVSILGIGITISILLDPTQMHRRVEAALREVFACPFRFDHPRVGLDGIAIRGLVLDLPREHGAPYGLAIPEVVIRPKLGSLISGPLTVHELRVTRPDLRIEYDPASGAFPLASIFRRRDDGPGPSIRRLVIEGARVEFCPACLPRILSLPEDRMPPSEWLALELDADGGIAPGGRVDLQATVRHPAFSRLSLEGTIQLDGSTVRLRASFRRLRIDEKLESFLPASLREAFRSIEAIGHADAEASIEIAAGRIVRASGQIDVLNCAGRIPPLPGFRSAYPVRHLSARARIGIDSIEIEEAKGTLGEGPFSARARMRFAPSWDEIREATFHLQAERIPLDERLRDSLDDGARRTWDRYAPSGAFGLVVDTRVPAPEGESAVEATVSLRGANMRYRYFPYPAEGLRGEIRIVGDKATISRPIETERGGARFAATGEFGLSSASAARIVIRAQDVPLDATLRAAFGRDHRGIWDLVDPGGIADAVATIEQPEGEGAEARIRVDVELKGASARYAGFPYRLEKLEGKLRFDDAGAEILGVRGMHGDSAIDIVEGSFAEGRNRIRARAAGLRVDPELRAALPAAFRQAIDDFGFEGIVGIEDATIESGPDGADIRYEIEVRIDSGRVKHARFPYPVDIAGGTVTIGPRGVTFEGIRGLGDSPSILLGHGSARDAEDGIRRFDISLDIGGLPIDGRLREALPEDLRRFIESVGLRGVFGAHVDLIYHHAIDDPSQYRVNYVVKASSALAEVDFGIRFRDLTGWTHLKGAAAHDASHVIYGTAKLERFTFHRARMGPTEISFAYGAPHEALGGTAPEDPAVPKAFAEDLSGERARTSFQASARRGDLYGGDVRGFLYVDVGPARSFGGAFEFGGVDLGAAAPDLLRVEDASGRGRGSVLFRGKIGRPETIEGKGEVRIEEAQLVRLPLILGLFRLLKLEIPKRTYFKDIRFDYRIREGRFAAPHWDSIELRSDALSFRGGGSLDFDLNADLYLSPVFFPGFEIPLLGPLLSKIKQNLVAIQVRGPLDDPQVSYILVKDIVDLLGGSGGSAP